MPKKLLISDANIIIDIYAGKLIDEALGLPYEYAVPDSLFEQELKVHHGDLVEKGLRLLELRPESITRVAELKQKHGGVSNNDLLALALAEQEGVALLTGDRKLRQVSMEEDIEVHGTVWLVGELLEQKLIDSDRARATYNEMNNRGSRLPQDEIEQQLSRYSKR